MKNAKNIIAVIGLGYVGLPIATEFSKKYPVIGFDINKKRVEQLKKNIDETLEIDSQTLQYCQQLTISEPNTPSRGLHLTHNSDNLKQANIFIVTVPTPVDKYNYPNLTPLLEATATVGKMLKKNDIVIYESTVYPGCTEEECVPILEKESKLKFNQDFFCGYSPERINPGDKIHTLTKIKKITSGSTEKTAQLVDQLYNSILENGTYKAPSIKIAEMAKIVENSQRDINISFVNEIALICDKMNIDTNDVIDAAASKWNFITYRPGLVGGHCIAVDPYYLVYKSAQLGYEPKVLLSGRSVNNHIPKFIAHKTIKTLVFKNIKIKNSSILILGITFKENCPDCRNTKIPEIIYELNEFGCNVDVYDPLADKNFVKKNYNIQLLPSIPMTKKYNAIILCVKHKIFQNINIKNLKKKNTIIFDIKNFLDKNLVDYRF